MHFNNCTLKPVWSIPIKMQLTQASEKKCFIGTITGQTQNKQRQARPGIS